MIFMRRHGAHHDLHRKVGDRVEPRMAYSKAVDSGKRPQTGRGGFKVQPYQLVLLGEALCLQSIESLEEAYRSWELDFREGWITEWDLLTIVRRLLKLQQQDF